MTSPSKKGKGGAGNYRLVSYDGSGRESANMMLYPSRAQMGTLHNRQFLNKTVRGASDQRKVPQPAQHFIAMGVSLQKNIQSEIYKGSGRRLG